MPIPDMMQTGRSSLTAAKLGIAVTGHNIANADTEGFSRQRILTSVADPMGLPYEHHRLGTGVRTQRVERLNDAYLEKQLWGIQRERSYCEEKDFSLRQIEDVLNELSDDGLNRLISRFFNEFRKLANEPENRAIRESVQEASHSLVQDFHRLRRELMEVRAHIDSKLQGFIKECNALLKQVAELNSHIKDFDNRQDGPPNDLLDRRDLLVKQLSSFFAIQMHPDEGGVWNIDLQGAGPLVTHFEAAQFDLKRVEGNTFDLVLSHHEGDLTNLVRSGKLGALLEVRDELLENLLDRFDLLAFRLTEEVNRVHRQGVSLDGRADLDFFKPLGEVACSAEKIDLSESVKKDPQAIATAKIPNAPGDNRIALALADLQFERFLGNGTATADDWYNALVSEIGVATSRNRFALVQQEDVYTQIQKMKEQISGVSIDEETTRLLEYQHLFDASSKVIQMADEMMRTVLNLKK